jgi:delta-aminolevulinic acid dehydratase/porphobilinogen synthase
LETKKEFARISDSVEVNQRAGSSRPRRLRVTESMRILVKETDVLPRNLVMPIFVKEGLGVREKIDSMPGVFRLSPDEMLDHEISDIK